MNTKIAQIAILLPKVNAKKPELILAGSLTASYFFQQVTDKGMRNPPG
jgi:hypothetical protein